MKQPDDLPSLEQLEKDIRSLNERVAPKTTPSQNNVGMVMRMGAELLSGAFVGALLGWYLDKWLNTSPVLFIICFFFGSAGGFLTLMRTMKEAEALSNTEDNKKVG